MRKDIGKRLTNGIAARLEYEYACQKAGDFDEKYLHSVMSQIISPLYLLMVPAADRMHLFAIGFHQ